MHRACWDQWESKQAFVDLFNQTQGTIVWGNGTKHHLLQSGEIEKLKA
jgi:hypothetical protein